MSTSGTSRRSVAILAVCLLALAGVGPAATAQDGGGAFVSDWFSGTSLDASVWSVTDPKGDGTVSVSDGLLSLGVPAGVTHNLWAGQDHALRVLQPAADVDFTAEARFASLPSTATQMQGILVRQDASNWVRFDVHRDGTGLRVFAARTLNGSSAHRISAASPLADPRWMRVEREGNTWSLSLSEDGTSWTPAGSFSQALQVTELGPFSGNFGSPASTSPAYTAQVDHFIEVGAEDPGDPDPEPEFTLSVDVTGSGSVAWDPERELYLDGEEVTLTATPAQGWTFTGWSGALSGTTSPSTLVMDADKQVTAAFTQDDPGDPDPDHTLSVDTVGSGTVTADPDKATYTAGEEVTLTATPAQGWTFTGWSGALSGTTSPSTLVMDADKQVSATFTQDDPGDPDPGDPDPDGVLRIMPVGDSITRGATNSPGPQATYRMFLYDHLVASGLAHGTDFELVGPYDTHPSHGYVRQGEWDHDSLSVSGWLTTNVRDNVGAAVSTHDPDVLLVLIGINDILTGSPPVLAAERVDQAIANARAARPDIAVMLAEIPPAGFQHLTSVQTYNATLRDLAAQRSTETSHVGTADLFTGYLRAEHHYDGLHPNEDGERLIASRWADALHDQLGIGEPWDHDEPPPAPVVTITDGPSGTVATADATFTFTSDVAGSTFGCRLDGGSWAACTSPHALTGLADGEHTLAVRATAAGVTGEPASRTWTVETSDPDPDPEHALSVTVTGSGTVAAAPDKATYGDGEEVTLTATPAEGWTFTGWDGALSGTTNPATLVMDGDKQVTATFTQDDPGDPDPGSGTFVSDWFGGTALDTSLWTVMDPKGDGTVSVSGGRLALSVPAKSTHNLWAGQDHALRVLQPAADADFTAEVKFDSLPTTKHQMQGVNVRQDASNWLRFEVHHNGSGLRAFAARTANGSSAMRFDVAVSLTAPMWLRVERDGNQWTMSLSDDGSSWSQAGSFVQALQVAELGPFAGNFNSPVAQTPAFTALVDHFVEVGAGEPDPTYGLSVQVNGSGTVGRDPDKTAYTAGEQVTLTATPAQGWTFTGWSGALSGSTNPATLVMDADKQVTATFTQDDPGDGPPVISNVAVNAGQDSAVVTWTTSVPADSRVDYGITTSYGAVSRDTQLVTGHSVTVQWLHCQRTYNYKVTSANAHGSATATGSFTAATCPNPGSGQPPQITLWHGDTQTFGQPAHSQQWVNLLGTVSSAHGISSLQYTINGGQARPLSVGPTPTRLSGHGDFNVEMHYEDLQVGANTVTITATDTGGRTSTKNVTVHRAAQSGTLALPFSTDWASAGSILERAQPVDGRWVIDGGAVRLQALDYDRLLTVGDINWTDYEVTVPVTVHELGPHAHTPHSGHPMVGLALRWTGHTQVDTEQPRRYWYPTGAFAWYRWGFNRFELVSNNGSPFQRHTGTQIQLGKTYVFKVRVETTSTGTRYRFRVWDQANPEPATWQMTVEDDGPTHGAIGLLAHHADARFGNVTVTPVP